jgi:hypothetical protein
MQKTFNAKTQRRQGATILNILLQFLNITIWLLPALGASLCIFPARFAALSLCAFALNFYDGGRENRSSGSGGVLQVWSTVTCRSSPGIFPGILRA